MLDDVDVNIEPGASDDGDDDDDDGDHDDDDNDDDDDDDDDDDEDGDDDDDDDNKSHMSSTVYLVEASWVGGTILRWHQQPNRHGDHMIYEQFSTESSRPMICEEFAENLQHYL